MRGNLREVGFVENDDGLRKVANEAAHFDMLTLADDNRLVAITDERGERVMRLLHERTSGIDDVVTRVLPCLAVFVGSPVCSDGDLMGGGAVQVVEVALLGADSGEMVVNERIVDKLA